jgi:hypothetical protein
VPPPLVWGGALKAWHACGPPYPDKMRHDRDSSRQWPLDHVQAADVGEHAELLLGHIEDAPRDVTGDARRMPTSQPPKAANATTDTLALNNSVARATR